MINQFSLFDLLLLVGIVQGTITSILLTVSKKNPYSNKFLALAIFSFCLLSVKMILYSLGLRENPHLRYFPIGIELFIAPLMYFYILSLITPKFKLQWKDSIHFIPFIISQGYSFFVFFQVSGDISIPIKDGIAESFYFNSIKNTEDYLALFSIIGYLSVAYFKLKDYREWLKNTISDNTYPSFNWLKNLFILSSVLGFFLLINLSADAIFNLKATNYFHWQAYYIFIASLIYYLGFVGYIQPNFKIDTPETSIKESKVIKLSDTKTIAVAEALEKELKINKVYLNPTLNAKDLAKSSGISQNDLSYVVNTSFKKNFRDLINSYRVEEVKLKLNDLEFQHMSILGIALECGFNSEASFYRIFKKNTGLSPKEYSQKSKASK